MKIVLTASGEGLDADMDSRFGRAKNFIVFDTETEAVSALDNSVNLNAAQGAGIQAAGNVAKSGAEVLITGHCGPKAFYVLKQAGIRVYTSDAKTVKESLDLFLKDKLKESSGSDVEGHW
ncbi:MAG: NifB/NifX family molybdenum-iron cluster-binding protein [Spirochaetia bacterium]|jgi:predicted Fe-Mo cluster-binding NifX family protein|nr:NifB/NifX family molybdenum-iron cluster-binding protein [Spirochaetia bacterium]